ncbi:MAG: cupin domain-containing protein [Vicinamibacterales bacterium]
MSPMPFYDLDALPTRQLFPGFVARLVHTPVVTQSFVQCDAGASFPEHQHPHEQTVVVLDGELELQVDGQAHRLRPGSAYVIPGNVPHSGTALVDTRVLDIFSPVREDLKA